MAHASHICCGKTASQGISISHVCVSTRTLCILYEYVRVCVSVFSSFSYFSALSITYVNPYTKASYFIIKHILCVLAFGSLFLSVSISFALAFLLSHPLSLYFFRFFFPYLYLSLHSISRENIFIFVSNAKACKRVHILCALCPALFSLFMYIVYGI